jgi:hypothetical protein
MKMNLLYNAVDLSLYTHYFADKVYPHEVYPFPDNVDEVLNFTACTNKNKYATAKILPMILLKMQNDVVNMNAALIDTLLSLIPMAFRLLYEQEWMMNPNAVIQQCFDWFAIKYGHTSVKHPETIWMALAANRHPSMGFEVLTLQLFCSVTFTSLSGHPVTDKDIVNISGRILNHTGLFPKEYTSWILYGNNARKMNNFVPFKICCENAVQVAVLTTIPASQHGYGTVATNNDVLGQMLTDVVSNFGLAYATKNCYNQTPPSSWQFRGSFKCSTRQSAPASPGVVHASVGQKLLKNNNS